MPVTAITDANTVIYVWHRGMLPPYLCTRQALFKSNAKKMEQFAETFNRKKSEEFAEKLLGIINGGPLALMISLGHRTGLFDVFGGLDEAGLTTVAEKSGLNERYIREWLGAMVTGGIIEYNSSQKTYSLPDEHKVWLTREAGPDNFAVYSQYTSVLGGVEDEILECFRKGGGVPYEKFNRFHEVMAEDSGLTVGSSLFDHILPLVPGLTDRLRKGISVLDIGCGKGRIMNKLAAAFPKSRFTGLDLCEEPVLAARADANEMGNENAWFETADLTDFEPESRYDLITAFDAVHDQAKPDRVLDMVYGSLRPGGVFLMQDISGHSSLEKNLDHPLGTMLYSISTMHCMTVSLAQGGAGLGTMWGEDTAQRMLGEAGFSNVSLHHLEHDIQNTYFVAHK